MKKSIEEQVAELTEQQKTTVIKVGIWGTIILLIVTVPLMIFVFSGFLSFIKAPLLIDRREFVIWLIVTLAGSIFYVIYFVVIKIVFPYYNDRKAIYLIKNRKKKS